MNYWLFVVPFISAAIGWLMGTIAANILVNKLIHTRKKEIAKEIGRAAGKMFSSAEIDKKISSPDNIKKVMPVVETHIDDFLRHKLKAKMPMIGMLIGDKTINSLKEIFLKEIEEMFPQVMAGFAVSIKEELNIESLVEAKIDSIQPQQIRTFLLPVMKYYRVTGGLVGFITGLLNLGIFSLS